MDVNDTLRIIRLTVKQYRIERRNPAMAVAYADQLAEHIESLDEWLTKGGFLPNEWQSK